MYSIYNHLAVRIHVTCSYKIAMQWAGYGYKVVCS